MDESQRVRIEYCLDLQRKNRLLENQQGELLFEIDKLKVDRFVAALIAFMGFTLLAIAIVAL